MLLAEAGTGTGKTFAYLVPALLSGMKTIISTGTKALQDQLYHRDLPRVRDALGIGLSTALLRARQLPVQVPAGAEQGRTANFSATASRSSQFQRIVAWGGRTRMGDLAELEALPEDSPLLPMVTSTAENCLGSECPFWSRMLRGAGAPARAVGGPGRRQPPPAARRPRAQAGRVRRDPAGRAGVRRRRGAPVAGAGRAVLRRRPRRAAAGGTRARCDRRVQGRAGRAGGRAAAGATSSNTPRARCARRWNRCRRAARGSARCTSRRARCAATRSRRRCCSSTETLAPLREASPGFDALPCARARIRRAACALAAWQAGATRSMTASTTTSMADAGTTTCAGTNSRRAVSACSARRWMSPARCARIANARARRGCSRRRRWRSPATSTTSRTRLGLDAPTTLLQPSPFDWNTQALCYLPPTLPEPMSRDYNAALVDALLPGAASLGRPRVRAVRLAPRAARSRRGPARRAVAIVRAGRRAAPRAAAALPRIRQRRAAGRGEFPRRRRCRRRGAERGGDRQAAVRRAGRSGVRGAAGGGAPRRRQSVPRRAAAAGGDRAQAGRRPPDPQRIAIAACWCCAIRACSARATAGCSSTRCRRCRARADIETCEAFFATRIRGHPSATRHETARLRNRHRSLLGRVVDRRRRASSASKSRRAAMPNCRCHGRSSCCRSRHRASRNSTRSPSGAAPARSPACAWRSRWRRASRWRWIGRWSPMSTLAALAMQSAGERIAGGDRCAHGRDLSRRVRARWRRPCVATR